MKRKGNAERESSLAYHAHSAMRLAVRGAGESAE